MAYPDVGITASRRRWLVHPVCVRPSTVLSANPSEETPGFCGINIAVLLGRFVAHPGMSWCAGATVAFTHSGSGLGPAHRGQRVPEAPRRIRPMATPSIKNQRHGTTFTARLLPNFSPKYGAGTSSLDSGQARTLWIYVWDEGWRVEGRPGFASEANPRSQGQGFHVQGFLCRSRAKVQKGGGCL